MPHFKAIGSVPCELAPLPYGDFSFEGNGPKGRITLGFERKTLHDILACVEDARYAAHQLPGMAKLYNKSFLIIEGMWRPHNPEGLLMESYSGKDFGRCKFSSRPVMYSKLRRYLISVAMAGVIVMYTRDPWHTAYDVVEHFHYFDKKWSNHTSLIEVQKLAIPTLNGKPSLTRRWASDLSDVGVNLSLEAERKFKHPIVLAAADAKDWAEIPGIGMKTAERIIKEIRG